MAHNFLGYLPTQYPINLERFGNQLAFVEEPNYYNILEISLVDNTLVVTFQYAKQYIDEWFSRWPNSSNSLQL